MNAALSSTQVMFDASRLVASNRPASSNRLAVSSPIATKAPAAQCDACALRKLCLPKACGSQSAQLEAVVRHSRPLLRRKEVVYHQGDDFESLYVIRTGSVKTFMLNENGEEHITGFYLPGDIIGIDGVSNSRHATTAMALESTSVCALPFNALEKLAASMPEVQRYVFQVMAKEILQDQKMMMLLSRKTADQRLAALLLRFSQHLQSRRLVSEEFVLPMSRGDIGNYLGLAIETVCRVITRFQKMNLLKVEGRSISLLNIEALQALADAVGEA